MKENQDLQQKIIGASEEIALSNTHYSSLKQEHSELYAKWIRVNKHNDDVEKLKSNVRKLEEALKA